MKEIIQDNYGNTVYLTDERWTHIVKRHAVLKDRKNDVLKTVRDGKPNNFVMTAYPITKR